MSWASREAYLARNPLRVREISERWPCGHKELIAVQDGYRESEQSWYELLIDLKQRGLLIAPQLAIGDGALGF